jgi:hypothetical protein
LRFFFQTGLIVTWHSFLDCVGLYPLFNAYFLVFAEVYIQTFNLHLTPPYHQLDELVVQLVADWGFHFERFKGGLQAICWGG